MKPQIDATHSPIYVVRWWPQLDLAELDAHFDDIIALVQSAPGRVGFVMDMSRSGRMPSLHRARGSEGLKRAYAAIGHKVAGVTHVIPEPLARSMMTIVYWLMPPPFPTEMVASVDAGIRWISGRLEALGQPVRVEPPSAPRRRAL